MPTLASSLTLDYISEELERDILKWLKMPTIMAAAKVKN
jgi:hypothetical protein